MIDPGELSIGLVSGTIVTVVFIRIAQEVCGSMEEGQPFHDTCHIVAELGLVALLLLGTVSVISIGGTIVMLLESSGGR
jgi:hypothetical protein